MMLLVACGGGGGGGGSGGGSGGSNNPPPTQSFTVTASAGTGGTISPASTNVTSGGSTTFTVTANTGYEIGEVTGCGGSLNGSTYTTSAITAACTVNATFKLKKYTVTASAGTGGSISPATASVDHGTTTAFTVTPQSDYIIASVTGCGGSLNGSTYTTSAVTAACAVNASFLKKVATTAISGVWTGTDTSRPAYITVTSESDDSFLKVVPIAADGSFTLTGLDASRKYIVEPEQSGTRVSTSSRVNTQSTGEDERIAAASAITTSTAFVTASPGEYLTFDGIKVPGLSEGEFVYRWEGNPTVSGAEYSSYIVNPVNDEIIGKTESPSDDQAAIRLAESFGIVLVNPGSASAGAAAMVWTNEYADRFLKLVSALGLPAYVDPITQKPRENFPPTYVTLTNRVLPEDLERMGSTYLGDKFAISETAFANATPSLARVEGKRGVFYSNRLFRALVRVVTNGGTDVTKLARLMKDRYGISVSSDSSTPIPLSALPSTCPQYPSDCQQAEWRLFKADELLELVSILEEYPTPLLNISFPDKQRGMRYFLRRRDGVFHPKYKQSDAVAWIPASYAEFMEKGFGGVQLDGVARERARQQRYQLIIHEKAHFIWSNLLDEKSRLDWSKLSGWWKSPLKPGEDPKVVGKCDEWARDPVAWSPPNTTAQDLIFDGSFGHDENISDADELRSSWGSCSTSQFVTAYAATNPNEDFGDSFASFMVNPELLKTRALPKYEFIRDRLMQGSIYLSRIRDDLTFQVLNLYPDYVYPGKIKSLEVRLTGGANQDKQGTVRITLHTSTCTASKNSGCFEGASEGFINIESKIFPDGSKQVKPISLRPINGNGAILEGSFSLSKFAAAGWWKNPQFTLRDAVGNERQLKATSADFGWRLYVNSPLEDVEAPAYLKNSVRFRVLEPGDPLISKGVTGDARELMVTWRLNEPNIPNSNGHCQATLVSNSARPSFGMVGNSRMLSNQVDGATMECVARWIVTRFFPTDRYFISALYTDDLAGNRREIRFSPKGEDPTLERSPEVVVTSSASDTVAPTLDITPCKASEIDERCLRVIARPTNPSSPNGETIVDLYYWAYEELPVSTASGLGRVDFTFRDPLGKAFSYPAECRDWYGGNTFGVPGKCPIDSGLGSPITADSSPYTNVYFLCPDGTASRPERTSSSRTDCTAVTPIQYHAQVILPVGSAPGTWGLLNMSVRDKVRNNRGYDFTENFRFTPSSSGDDERVSAFGDSASGNPFTFEVAGVGSKPPSISSVVISSARDALSAVFSTVSHWVSKAASWITNGVTRVATWVQGGVQSGLHLARSELGFESNDAVTTNRKGEASRSSNSATAEGDVISIAEDPLTGSRYQILREEKLGADRQQGWKLEYRSSTDTLFASKTLPDTSEVLWRAPRSPNALPTTAWTQVCSDRVWSVQDGYQMLFHVGDRSLGDLRPGQLWVNSQAEVTVIEDLRCAFGGAIWVEGYAFGANDREPLLRGERVTASRFGFALDRFGAVSKREVTTANFEVPQFCAEPANEQLMFCAAAKKVVGW